MKPMNFDRADYLPRSVDLGRHLVVIAGTILSSWLFYDVTGGHAANVFAALEQNPHAHVDFIMALGNAHGPLFAFLAANLIIAAGIVFALFPIIALGFWHVLFVTIPDWMAEAYQRGEMG